VATPDVDLLVIGAGSAGLVAARTARSLGASVLLVEQERFGGDCLWTGCVPSKALVAAGNAAADARAADALGVHAEVRVDGAGVVAGIEAAVRRIEPVDAPEALHAIGVRTATGTAFLTGRTATADAVTADVAGETVTAGRVVLATGATPVVPAVPGLQALAPDTSATLWAALAAHGGLPERLAVLGGGPVGCEIAQAMARLGVAVTLISRADRLLTREDPDASALIARALRNDGVDVRLGVRAVSADGDPDQGVLHLTGGTTAGFDRLLLAVGRRPTTDGLGLGSTSAATRADGSVVVDHTQRTADARVFAAGDVTGPPYWTHLAGVTGSNAAANALLGTRRALDPSTVGRVTFTRPEVAAVGVTSAGSRMTVRTTQHTHLDRAVTDRATDGFTRLVVDHRGRVVGATVVGPRAGETLGELALAVRHGLRTRDVTATVHPYPTFSDGVWDAAITDTRARLAGPLSSRAIDALRRLRAR
jgi:pyruvate/2-oxoglutarate dehydrogenase complex dihydrolipoamide dehydrogenase (E3) component